MALFRARQSIRRYRPDPVPDDMLEQLLEAGRIAPSASNRQPWAFIVIRDRQRIEQVAEYAAYYFVRWAHVQECPLIIVLCGYRGSRVYRQFLHEDIGIAGTQIMLQAEALGLGTCWIGGLDRQALVSLLEVPEDWEIVGLLTVGFPAEDPEPRPRKPLADVVHYDVFGNFAPDASPRAGRGPGGILRTVFRWLNVKIRS
jgi:nitroreductase